MLASHVIYARCRFTAIDLTSRSQACIHYAAYQPRARMQVMAAASSELNRLVFLGTPEVAATVLRRLMQASKQADARFAVTAVVSQPGKPKGRGNRGLATPSPVEATARDLGLQDDQILCPASAKDPAFLQYLAALDPDLCVTAAYGNMLPKAFLAIPRLGTLNIHPSLLPLYRGAAPVQRAVQDGVAETGVSVAYTVLKCDAGPVLDQRKVAVDPDIQAPELLSNLFALGTDLLLSRLPDVWEGRGPALAVPQGVGVRHAAKLQREESALDLATQDALTLHNKVRAFAGWPGTSVSLVLEDESTGLREPLDVKILNTCVVGTEAASSLPREQVSWLGDDLVLPCGGGGMLRVLRLQPPTKKAMPARDFRNGLRGKRLLLRP